MATNFTLGSVTRRPSNGGVWVTGRATSETGASYRYEALVFSAHAESPEFELGDSRISKLWIQNRFTRETVFNWDRGLDKEATSDEAKELVVVIAAELSQRIFGS